jgi:alkylation response protein AidB-like acyl-CoA dehydrogenase
MPTYFAPVKDQQFILHDVLKLSASNIPGYSDLDHEFTAAILEESGKLANEVMAPLNVIGDKEGCHLENGVVRTPDGFKEAFEQFRAGGWASIDMPEKYGGQYIPSVLASAVNNIS